MCNTTETPETVTISLSRYEYLKKSAEKLDEFVLSNYVVLQQTSWHAELYYLKGHQTADAVSDRFAELRQELNDKEVEIKKLKSSFWYRLFNRDRY